MFGIECDVYMVKISYEQKPYRKAIMNSFGGNVYSSPSNRTKAGRDILEKDPNTSGSLGIAISEAIELAVQDEHTKYALGSVLNHVLMHQTIIGEECLLQLEKAGDFPDIVIAPLGGGSNFAGISFPFLRHNLQNGKKVKCIAVEPASCPKLTKGEFRYDFGDTAGYTPLLPMYTLGHNFRPAAIHAGGLRYHGASVLCSQLLRDNLISAVAIQQLECFEAGITFAKAEGIMPAPEANHAIAQVIREAKKAKEEGSSKTILFNLCGHGHLDMQAYQDYFDGKLKDHFLSEEDLTSGLKELSGYPSV
jgi:tryptophan synthase beta chain